MVLYLAECGLHRNLYYYNDRKGNIPFPGGNEMFEKIKNLLVEELSVKEEDVTMSAELVNDLGINSLELADLVLGTTRARWVGSFRHHPHGHPGAHDASHPHEHRHV